MQRMFQNHYVDSMASVLAVDSKGKEMQRAVILGQAKGLKHQDMKIEFCSPATLASDWEEVMVSKYTKGRKDSYQTSQCKCSAVRLTLLLSQAHWTPWLCSRCQKTRGIFSITQTISIIMQVGDVCASRWSLSFVVLQGSKETKRKLSGQSSDPIKASLSYPKS